MFKSFLIAISAICFTTSFGQKNLTLQDCENLFQKNNLLLLSEQFAVSAADAAIIQAKIWEHPYIEADMNLYNPTQNKYFDIGEKGQKQFAVQQLIYLGGKKRNEINLAKSNAKLARLQYEQLIRSLVLETRKNFYGLYFDLNKYKSIDNQLAYLDDLISSYSKQTEKGNIALKDLVRLQSLALSLKSDLLEIKKSILTYQETLKIITNSEEEITPVIDTRELVQKLNKPILYPESKLQEITLEKNPDYLSSVALIQNSELMVKWQQSLSVPDITLGANYDQRSGAFENQLNFSVGIPLPLWNKNKGTIKAAKAGLQQNQMLSDQKRIELKARVSSAMEIFLFQQKQYKQSENSFDNLEVVNQGILSNFLKKNISLIEFTDFMESYNQSALYLNQIKKELIISGEYINYLTTDTIF